MKPTSMILAAALLAGAPLVRAQPSGGPSRQMHPPVIVEERTFRPGRFTLEIDGVRGAFTDIQGLETVVDPVDYRTGGDSAHVRKIPGLRKHPNLTLKRGLVPDDALFRWWKSSRTQPRSAHLVEVGGANRRYELYGCLLTQYTAPALDSRSHAPASETVQIRCERHEIK